MAENIKFRDILKSLIQILYIILIIFVAYQVLKAIISGTWANENIIIAGMGIILAGMFVIVGFLINQGKCLGMLDERTRNIGDSLSNMGRDLKQHLVSSRM
jgi:hydrogenase-4 membrane subunit HyfE